MTNLNSFELSVDSYAQKMRFECPNTFCSSKLFMLSATDRSVLITCIGCSKKWFYRRVESV